MKRQDDRAKAYFLTRWKLYYGDDRGFNAWWSRLADKTACRTRAADDRRAEIRAREVTR